MDLKTAREFFLTASLISGALNNYITGNGAKRRMAEQKEYVVVNLNGKEIFTLPEAADFLNVSKEFVYKLYREREIPFARLGKRILFMKQDLLKWMSDKVTESSGFVGEDLEEVEE